MKRPLLIGVFLLLTSSVVGCGTDNSRPNAPGDSTYAFEVVWNNHVYTVGKQIDKVGSQIGTVMHYDANPKPIENNGSNFFTVGTKLFSIPGKNTKDQIGAKYSGKYWECDLLNQSGS